MELNTRRSILSAGVSLITVSLGGCLSSNGSSEPAEPVPAIESVAVADPQVVEHTTNQVNEDPAMQQYNVTVSNIRSTGGVSVVLYKITTPPSDNGTNNNTNNNTTLDELDDSNLTPVNSTVQSVPRDENKTVSFVRSEDDIIDEYTFAVIPREFVVTVINEGNPGDVNVSLITENGAVIDEQIVTLQNGQQKSVELVNSDYLTEPDYEVKVESVTSSAD